MVYSTFIYLLNEAEDRWPGINLEIVPSVTSLTAVPAAIQTPLADGLERIAVIPATYGTDDLRDVLRNFDTILLMKVKSVMQEVVDVLTEEGLLDKAKYISKASTDQERIVDDIRTVDVSTCDYFSMVVIAKRERSGVLAGHVDSKGNKIDA